MEQLTRRDLLAWLAGVPMAVPMRREPAAPSHDNLLALAAVDIVARVKSRELSALELADAYLARIASINPSIAAFVTVSGDRARADARRIDRLGQGASTLGVLAGVPIAHKDLFETEGIRTTAGSRLYERHIPRRDADIVRWLAASGTVLLGKTNTHELGGGVTTINPFYGTTRNPWDRSRIAGGSSGGSAAAIVAGLTVAATGSDTGGSVRIPAALCGCVGFKPSFGRLSTRGLLGACPTFDHAGLLTRTVADAEVFFSAVPAVPSTRAAQRVQARALRIGIARNFFFDSVATDVGRGVEDAIGVLRSFANDVRDVTFPIDSGTMARVFDPIVVSEIQARFAADWKSRPDAFSPSFSAVFRAERPAPAAIDAARQALASYRRDVEALFQSIDVLVTPAVPIAAAQIEGPIDGGLLLRNTWPFNAAGTPAVSLPCGFDRQGLPIGLQLVSAAGRDDLVLAAARRYEEETSWHRRRPAVG